MIEKSKLAVASFVIGALSFIHLFGLEKALMAIIFGALALKEIERRQLSGKKYAYAAIILGSLYILIIAVLAAVKGPQIVESLGKMR